MQRRHENAKVLERYFSGWGPTPLRSMEYKPQDRLPSLQPKSQKGAQIKYNYEKQQGFCPPGRNSYRCREPVKVPTHKISFAATYPGLWQRKGRVEERHMRGV